MHDHTSWSLTCSARLVWESASCWRRLHVKKLKKKKKKKVTHSWIVYMLMGIYVCILDSKSYHMFSSFWAAVTSLSSAAAWHKAEQFCSSLVLATWELHHACVHNIFFFLNKFLECPVLACNYDGKLCCSLYYQSLILISTQSMIQLPCITFWLSLSEQWHSQDLHAEHGTTFSL